MATKEQGPSGDVETKNCTPAEKQDSLSDYERYCQEQSAAFFDDIGDDRCFGDMAEGIFVRGH